MSGLINLCDVDDEEFLRVVVFEMIRRKMDPMSIVLARKDEGAEPDEDGNVEVDIFVERFGEEEEVEQ